jgi:hypothetical protein
VEKPGLLIDELKNEVRSCERHTEVTKKLVDDLQEELEADIKK